MTDYAHPEVLVTTDWVASHLNDPNIRLIEVDVDTSAYDQRPRSRSNRMELANAIARHPAPRSGRPAHVLDSSPAAPVFAGDDRDPLRRITTNWFAAWGFWQLKYYGHNDVRLMNGGRKKWLEEKRPLSTDAPKVASRPRIRRNLPTRRFARNAKIFFLRAREAFPAQLVDVRSPDEFSGKVIAPPGMTETAQRGGHIPGAASIPWAQAVAEDGTFKPADALASFTAARASPANRKSSRIAASGSVARTPGSS